MQKNIILMFLLLMPVILGGCVASPAVVMESGFQRKVITPCDNDVLCFRHTYDVTWDTACREKKLANRSACENYKAKRQYGYPVTYRSSEYIFETGSYGYSVTLPAGGALRIVQDDKASNN